MSKSETKAVETPKEAKTTKSVVEPSIKIEGHTNPFIPFYDKKGPVLKAVGFVQLPGTNDYVSYVAYIQGSKVIKVVADEPNIRMTAEEQSKIAFVNEFIRSEEF